MHIEPRSTYMGESSYHVHGDGRESYELRYRFAPGGAYFRDIYTGGHEQFDRDIDGKIFLVSKCGEKISQPVFAMFYAKLQKEWDEFLKWSEERKEKYANDPEVREIYDHRGPACPLVYPAYWDGGWHEIFYERKQ